MLVTPPKINIWNPKIGGFGKCFSFSFSVGIFRFQPLVCGGLRLGFRNEFFSGCFNTPLEHTPKPLPTGHKGIPFIVGGVGVCCIFFGVLYLHLLPGETKSSDYFVDLYPLEATV